MRSIPIPDISDSEVLFKGKCAIIRLKYHDLLISSYMLWCVYLIASGKITGS